uniref:hypothetical protein n=1 Tax=Crassiphycus birdiae TaxID=2782747 RepID=UPI001D126C7D|nr:hypothetical protein LK100_pgp145 [Crassiphycus birdiae]UAD83102.1 hypothetical protein [Crassiphycus birdiae]
MKQIQTLLIPIILSNSFQAYSRKIIDEHLPIYSNVLTSFEENVHLRQNYLMQVILVSPNKGPKKIQLKTKDYIYIGQENDIEFISNIKDNLFSKLGSSYTERTESRGKKNSKIESTLIFRRRTKSRNGKKQSCKGSSSSTHPENLANFEKAGIPIDPMKDRRKKTDEHNTWEWDKEKERWKIVGELKMKIEGMDKVLTESEWNDLVRKSKKI